MASSDDVAGIKSKLNSERAKLLEAFKGLSPDVMTRPLDGGWSIKEILGHIAMAEGVNTKFAMLMTSKEAPAQLDELAGEYPDYTMPFELDKFNAWMTERWRKKSLIEIIDALHATRAETLAWLDTLTPAQLEKNGEHAMWGNQSVRGMFKILVIHDKFHRADIQKRKSIK